VPYLALGGGVVRIPAVTDHLATCVDLVDASGFEVAVEERPDGAVLAGNGPGG
jgi:RNA 3'-terminal phosphate cyclase (ATP)